MAILDFALGNNFAPAWKKALLKVQEAIDPTPDYSASTPMEDPGMWDDPFAYYQPEYEIPEDTSYQYIEPESPWDAPAEIGSAFQQDWWLPEESAPLYEDPAIYDDPWAYEQPAYDIPADTSYTFEEPSLFVDPWTGQQSEPSEPWDMQSAVGDFASNWFPWGFEKPTPAYDSPAFDFPAYDETWQPPGRIQFPEAPPFNLEDGFSGRLMDHVDKHIGDPWGEVLDMRGFEEPTGWDIPGMEPTPPPEFTGLETVDSSWQQPSGGFSSIFDGVYEGAKKAFLPEEKPIDYELSFDWATPAADPELPPEWWTMNPQEKAEYVYFSGLDSSKLTEAERGSLPPEWQTRLGFADSQEVGGISNGFKSIWDKIELANANIFEPVGDAVIDPILDPLTSTGNIISPLQPDFWSDGLKLDINLGGDPDKVDWSLPLEDTVQNALSAENPGDFLRAQEEGWEERPFIQQVALQALAPGNGLYQADDIPRFLQYIDEAADIAQGGKVLGALGEIPGVSSAARSILLPGAAGGAAGAVTEAVFDPEFTDPVTGEVYDPGFIESILAGGALGVGLKKGGIPFRAGIEEVGEGAVRRNIVDEALARIDITQAAREGNIAGARARFNQFQSDVTREAIEETGDQSSGLDLAASRLRDRPMERLADTPDFTPEEILEIRQVALNNAEELGYGLQSQHAIRRVINQWTDPALSNPAPSELRMLGRVLRGESWETRLGDEAAETIETIVPRAGDDAIDPQIRDQWQGSIDQIRAERGMDAPQQAGEKLPGIGKSVRSVVDEVADARLKPEEMATIGARDPEFVSREITPGIPENISGNVGSQTSMDSLLAEPFESADVTPPIRHTDRQFQFGDDGDITLTDTQPDIGLSFIDDLMPYIPEPRQDRVRSDWERLIGTPAKFVSDVDGSESRTKEVYEFIDSLSPYVPAERRAAARSEWDEVMASGTRGEQDLLTNITQAGATISQATPIAEKADAATLPKAVAEFSDPGPATIESVPEKVRPAIQEWEQATRTRAETLSEGRRADFLDKEQLALSRQLRGDVPESTAARLADNARERVTSALLSGRKASVDADVSRWLEENVPVFNNIPIEAKTHRMTERLIGGAIENRLANTMIQRGRNLSEQLLSRGLPQDEVDDVVSAQYAKYLDARLMDELATVLPTEQRNVLMERALTALRVGGSVVSDPRGYVKADPDAGNLGGFWPAARSVTSKAKNQMYGFLDASAIMGNALPALQSGWLPLANGYMQIVLRAIGAKGIDTADARAAARLAGLQGARVQDQTVPDEGTFLFSVPARLADMAGKDNKVARGLRATDRGAAKWNKLLTKAQFDLLLTQALRNPIYEGNLVLLKATGQDINDPKVRRAAARMANAVTSAAPQATGAYRMTQEGALLNTANFTRAQGELLLGAMKLFNPKATMAERTLGATTVATTLASIWGAQKLLGNDFEIDPREPDFAQIRLPSGKVMSIGNAQRQLANFAIDVGDYLVKVADPNESASESDLYQNTVKFILGRSSPLISGGAKVFDVGYDPNGETPGWNIPSLGSLKGAGDGWGQDASLFEKALGILPVPTGLQTTGLPTAKTLAGNGNTDPVDFISGLIGGNPFDESKISVGIRADAASGVFKDADGNPLHPESYQDLSMTQKKDFLLRHPEVQFPGSDVVRSFQNDKANESKLFEKSGTTNTARKWRDDINRLNAQIAGAMVQQKLEYPSKKYDLREDQLISEFNSLYALAHKVNEDGTQSSLIDTDKLRELQTEFYKRNPEPEVRKTVLDYQKAGKASEAEKLYIDDMARLNGIDPETGNALMYPGTNSPMPNYFEMPRYQYSVIDNKSANQVLVRFDNWRKKLTGPVAGEDRSSLLKMYLEKVETTAPDGRSWDPVRMDDIMNVGKPSKETPQFEHYKELMEPELSWFGEDNLWDTISALHEQREWK